MKSKIISHNNWINEINEYLGLKSQDDVIRFALSYTLQSLRNNEDLKRFNWGEKNE